MIDLRAVKALVVRHEKLLAELAEVERQLRERVDQALLTGDPPVVPLPAPLPAPVALVPPPAPPAEAVVVALPSPPAPPEELPSDFPRKIDFLLYMLRRGGGTLDLSRCAGLLYGSDSLKNRNRVSRILNYMVSRAVIRHAGRPNTYDILGKIE